MARQQIEVVLWQLTTVIVLAALLVLVESQDQSGFISIDCGSSKSYTESTTEINYVPDAGYISSGESKVVATQYTTDITEQFKTVRSFPEGAKNCYILPQQARNASYLIRARFMYGNYDSRLKLPQFDLYVGVNFWTTVTILEVDSVLRKEMIHKPPASSDAINVCLVNKGLGIPFISTLELRTIKDNSDVYVSQSGSMALLYRLNLGSSSTNPYRYNYDVYDRIWNTVDWSDTYTSIATNKTVKPNVFNQPSEVMSTGVTPMDPLKSIEFYLSTKLNPDAQYYFYLHFAEVQTLADDELREFDIYLNDTKYFGPLQPQLHIADTIYSLPTRPKSATSSLNFSFRMTANSTLPPILNAFEAYTLIDTSQLETDSKDDEAINNIKSAYNVSRIWQGDPCAPQNYSWDGLNCSFSDNQSPRIISLDLSSSGLKGKISNYISGLIKLQKLNLSNNNLTGTVPEFLSTMTSLNFLDLSGNNLTGIIPADLVRKSEEGSLTLNIERNPYLCLSNSCNGSPPADGSGNNKKKTSLVIPIVAAIAGVVIILIILAFFLVFCIFKKKKPPGASNTSSLVIPPPVPAPIISSIVQETSRFTFSDVLEMTNNFARVIGRGGFGSVYYGYLNGVEVAVKMLSPSSSQGYKEFKAEAQILMKVHHRNLTSLIGYCDEGENMGLIYEFMSQGDLYSHISDKNPQYLTWEERLRITVDAAQGLEYLHHGCKPPLVHRDIKTNNILLNDKLEAKLADFGLSRACTPDVAQTAFVQTMPAGTPGYLDPEYYRTQRLNEKSDVFSYGIVLLEVITSKPVMVGRTHISKWVSDIISTQGDIKAIIDPRMRGDYDTNSVWKAVEVAMSCVKHTSNQRPSMSQVVIELSQCLIMEKARKENEAGYTNNTMDSVEMASLGINNAYTPSPR